MLIVSVSYVIMLVITIVLLYRQEQRPYVFCKTVTSVLFLVAAWMAFQEGNGDFAAGYDSPEERFKALMYLGGGLIFCLGGDVLLALAHEIDNQLTQPKFTLGVGSFLIAHILFCIELIRMAGKEITPMVAFTLVPVIVVIVTTHSDKYDYGSNKLSTTFYSFFIGGLCALSLNLVWLFGLSGAYGTLGVGGCLFFLSDYMLSLKFFRKEKPAWLGAGVLLTYYSATWLIAMSLQWA